jgi:hypothetical protein
MIWNSHFKGISKTVHLFRHVRSFEPHVAGFKLPDRIQTRYGTPTLNAVTSFWFLFN